MGFFFKGCELPADCAAQLITAGRKRDHINPILYLCFGYWCKLGSTFKILYLLLDPTRIQDPQCTTFVHKGPPPCL